MAINAESPKDAYAAFRDNDRKDKIAQTGVYVYLINVTDVFGEKHTYNGLVTLAKNGKRLKNMWKR